MVIPIGTWRCSVSLGGIICAKNRSAQMVTYGTSFDICGASASPEEECRGVRSPLSGLSRQSSVTLRLDIKEVSALQNFVSEVCSRVAGEERCRGPGGHVTAHTV
ncbi:hypothetical protein NDU88_005480 [Pleurodeles waltl]|uniref:Uncharacterized protein n=1 Tax=Pleurodeles waltl TaxID=8319 RepID=A0AAV7MBB7_PLEWA|nr:hypothetical protein NDU88_005480 [Pleurodeles waltl]